MFPLRRLILATWSIWFPRAHTAIWHTFLAALSHPVAGDGDTAVAQTDCPTTTLLEQTRPILAQQSLKSQEFRLGSTPGSSWSSLGGRQGGGGHWLMQENNSSNMESDTTDLGSNPSRTLLPHELMSLICHLGKTSGPYFQKAVSRNGSGYLKY